MRYFSGKLPDCFSEHCGRILFLISTTLNPCSVENSKISSEFLRLFETAIPDKIFGTKWSNPVKLDRKKKV